LSGGADGEEDGFFWELLVDDGIALLRGGATAFDGGRGGWGHETVKS
jgi:hypothetical protein